MTVGELIKLLENTDKDRLVLIEDSKFVTELLDTADIKCKRKKIVQVRALYKYEIEGDFGNVSQDFQNEANAFLLTANSYGIRD